MSSVPLPTRVLEGGDPIADATQEAGAASFDARAAPSKQERPLSTVDEARAARRRSQAGGAESRRTRDFREWLGQKEAQKREIAAALRGEIAVRPSAPIATGPGHPWSVNLRLDPLAKDRFVLFQRRSGTTATATTATRESYLRHSRFRIIADAPIRSQWERDQRRWRKIPS